MSSPDKETLDRIARQAEQDLNSYESKTGSGRDRATDYEPAGVSDTLVSKFPGAQVKYGDDLVTSAGYDRRMPPDEGGDIDDHGRFIHGHAYEGIGGPEDKMAHIYQHNPGGMDESIIKKWGKDPRKLVSETVDKSRPNLLPMDEQPYPMEDEAPKASEAMERGRRAGEVNLGRPETSHKELPSRGSKRSMYKGSDYYAPESVPDTASQQGEVPPASVINARRAGGA
ncbi:hypothetical protein OQA88_5139 [Cercophora sp. LCS_1]